MLERCSKVFIAVLICCVACGAPGASADLTTNRNRGAQKLYTKARSIIASFRKKEVAILRTAMRAKLPFCAYAPCDVNFDGQIDFRDYSLLGACLGIYNRQIGLCMAIDTDRDGLIDDDDYNQCIHPAQRPCSTAPAAATPNPEKVRKLEEKRTKKLDAAIAAIRKRVNLFEASQKRWVDAAIDHGKPFCRFSRADLSFNLSLNDDQQLMQACQQAGRETFYTPFCDVNENGRVESTDWAAFEQNQQLVGSAEQRVCPDIYSGT